jgi:hypothetical protein
LFFFALMRKMHYILKIGRLLENNLSNKWTVEGIVEVFCIVVPDSHV